MNIKGDIESETARKDQDFNDLQKYLSVKYPNVLVPWISECEHMKKFTADYMNKRKQQLSRFMNYCFNNETIKQDFLFDQFVDLRDQGEYKKQYTKIAKTIEEIKNINQITSLIEEPIGTTITLPDPERIDRGVKTQKTLGQILRIYNNSNQRIHHNMNRL